MAPWPPRAAGAKVAAARTGPPKPCLLLHEQSHLPTGGHNCGTSINTSPWAGVTHKPRVTMGRGRGRWPPAFPTCQGRCARGPPERPRCRLLGGEFPESPVGSRIKGRAGFRQLLVWGLFLINSSLAHAESALSLPPGSSNPMHIEELDSFPRAKYKSHLS